VGNSQFYTGIAHTQPTPGGAVVCFLHTAQVLKVLRRRLKTNRENNEDSWHALP
jgi:hypothetical protein